MLKDEINQTFCLIATGGHLWMRGHFDRFPSVVRQRLRKSPFNLCPACLETKVLPAVRRQHPNWSQLFTAIEIMEAQVRKEAQ